MKTLKHITSALAIVALSATVASCDKEKAENEEAPEIMFKSGGSYTSSNETVSVGDNITIGIEAEVREEKDPLVKFNISKKENGGSLEDVYNEDLSDESFEYDYSFEVEAEDEGKTIEYIFTVTNRDGLIGQKELELTIE